MVMERWRPMRITERTETGGRKVFDMGTRHGIHMTTNLMELVGSVRDAVDEMDPDEERLVTLVVYRLLGGRGYPDREDSIQVLQQGPPSSIS